MRHASARGEELMNPRARFRLLAIGLAVLALAAVAASEAYAFGSPELDYIILYEGGGGKTLNINNFGTIGVWTGNLGIGNTGQRHATGPGTLNGFIDFSAPDTGQASISNTTLN